MTKTILQKRIIFLRKGCGRFYSKGFNGEHEFKCGDKSRKSERILLCCYCKRELLGMFFVLENLGIDLAEVIK